MPGPVGGINANSAQVNPFELPGKLSQSQSRDIVDMTGWVDVELPKDVDNRIGLEGLDRIAHVSVGNRNGNEELALIEEVSADAGGPNEACGELVDRLKTVALRETDFEVSRKLLNDAIAGLRNTVSGLNEQDLEELDLKRAAAYHAMKDLDALTGREIALAGQEIAHGDAQQRARVELARALLKDAVMAQKAYANALEKCASGLEEGSSWKQAFVELKNRTLRRAGLIIDLWRELKGAQDKIPQNPDEVTSNQVLMDRRGFTDRIYDRERPVSDEQMSTDTSKLFEELKAKYAGDTAKQDRVWDVAAASARKIIGQIDFPQIRRLDSLLSMIRPDSRGVEGRGVEDLRKSVKTICECLAEAKSSLEELTVQLWKSKGQQPLTQAAEKALESAKAAFEQIDEQLKAVADIELGSIPCPYRDRWFAEQVLELVHSLDAKSLKRGSGGELRIKNIQDAFRNVSNAIRDASNATLPDESKIRLSEHDLLALAEGTRRFSSSVEAFVWGANGLHDSALDGMELVAVKPLGKGAFNEVKLCTFVDAKGRMTQRVFRPDNGAYHSLQNGAMFYFLEKPGDISGFAYNHASDVVATAVGCNEVFPATTFGTLDGEPGMFLSVAPGNAGGDFGSRANAPKLKQNLSNDAKREISAEVARKLNLLQWLDILTGQVDRHWNNLMIGVTEDKAVSVKGIDNDQCFPDCYIGGGRYVFRDAAHANRFFDRIKRHSGEEWSEEPLGYCRSLTDDVALDQEIKGEYGDRPDCLVLNVYDLPVADWRKILRLYKNFGTPDHIDVSLFWSLKYINPADYRQMLEDAHLNDDQVRCAMARFYYVRDMALELENEGKVIGEGPDRRWDSADTLRMINGDEPNKAFRDKVRQTVVKDRVPDVSQDRVCEECLGCASQMSNYFARVKFWGYMLGNDGRNGARP